MSKNKHRPSLASAGTNEVPSTTEQVPKVIWDDAEAPEKTAEPNSPVPAMPDPPAEVRELGELASQQLRAMVPIEDMSAMDAERLVFMLDCVGSVALKTLLVDYKLDPWLVCAGLAYMGELVKLHFLAQNVHTEDVEMIHETAKAWARKCFAREKVPIQ
jgi:hypothetical protein